MLSRHSDPRPCHSASLPDPPHPPSLSPPSCHVHILVYCLRTIRYGLGRCFWGELYTHTSSDKGSSRQPWPLCCPTHPYSQPPPPHQHQPLPLTHSIGPRCACGITCHVHDLPYIPLDYPSQVLSRHSDPRPCHSASLPDPISLSHPPTHEFHAVYCLIPRTVCP